MTKIEKTKILKLSNQAYNAFFNYQKFCDKIALLLNKYSKVEVLEVLYQMSDGLVVAIPNKNIMLADDNIPINEFLEKYTTKGE